MNVTSTLHCTGKRDMLCVKARLMVKTNQSYILIKQMLHMHRVLILISIKSILSVLTVDTSLPRCSK